VTGVPARFDAFLDRRVAVARDDVGALAGHLGHRLDEFGAAVDQSDTVVRAVGDGQGAVGHEPVDQGAAARVAVVMHPVAVRQEAQRVGERAEFGAVRVGGAALEPAQRSRADPAEHHAGLPGPAHDPVEAVHPPHGEQVRHRAAHHPHHVLLQDGALDVVQVGHGEELERREVETGHPRRLVHPCREVFGVPDGRADVHDAWPAAVGAREVDGVVHQRVERHHGATAGAVSSGGGEDRRVCGH
jgi:hypothetical protein